MNLSEAIKYLSSNKRAGFAFDSVFGGTICKPSTINDKVIASNVELQNALVALFDNVPSNQEVTNDDLTITQAKSAKDGSVYFLWKSNSIKPSTTVESLMAKIRPNEIAQVVEEDSF